MSNMGIHLIQHDDGYGRMSRVLCREHQPEHFDYLKRHQIGCTGMPAPAGAKCEECADGPQ